MPTIRLADGSKYYNSVLGKNQFIRSDIALPVWRIQARKFCCSTSAPRQPKNILKQLFFFEIAM